jgi:hypothetical protein
LAAQKNGSNKLKNFFVGLISFKKNSNHNKHLEKKPALKQSTSLNNQISVRLDERRSSKDFNELIFVEDFSQIEIIEHTDLKHRFLTVKNKDLRLFKEYRNQSIKNADEFRYKIYFVYFFGSYNSIY